LKAIEDELTKFGAGQELGLPQVIFISHKRNDRRIKLTLHSLLLLEGSLPVNLRYYKA